MDFMFTDEQQMLRDGVSRYLANDYDFDARRALVQSDQAWSPDVWQQFAEFGLLALPFAESQGGLGGSIADIVAVSELFGRISGRRTLYRIDIAVRARPGSEPIRQPG